MSAKVRNIAIGAGGMLLLLILFALLVVLAGGYNVAATAPDGPITDWALTTTMTNHVQSAAADLTPPPTITPAMIAAGAGEYKAMCQHCHGGAGTPREEWAQTMRPKPPPLAGAARRWTTQEVYWIVKHGIKMSGMPAFGPSHDEATLWSIAAFVHKLPEMSAQQYASYPAEEEGEHHHHKG